ncbi:MAG: PEPxxWA-CTERM sorting domain-containing protein [Pseudomonadota bacterium]
MKKLMGLGLVALAASMAAPASAAIVTLDFEGIANNTSVGNYYNGGAGTNYGVSFSAATLALVDSDAGGSGNFANEPSANTIMFFLDANNAILNVAAGFNTGFSFWYTSSTAAAVTVWDGLNGTGNLLGTINLNAQHTQNCGGDPNGTFCNWTNAGVSFAGTAKSINFGGTANQTGYDNITFGSSRATGGAVPEPATWAMMIGGFGAIGVAARRRRRMTVSFA